LLCVCADLTCSSLCLRSKTIDEKKDEKSEKSEAAAAAPAPAARKADESSLVYSAVELDPAQGFAVARSVALGNMPPLSKVARVTQPCARCKKFLYAGDSHFSSETGQRWCEECHTKGYRGAYKSYHFSMPPVKTEDADYPCYYTPRVEGNPPNARFGATLTPAVKDGASVAYYFGGASGRMLEYQNCPSYVDNTYNDMYQLNIDSFTWQSVSDIKGEAPAARVGHTATEWRGDIYYFGGAKDDTCEKTMESVLYKFEVATHTWSTVSTTGQAPEPRAFHSATLIGDTLYIYGGKKEQTAHKDMYELNMAEMKWSKPKLGGSPPARYGHTMIHYKGVLFLVTCPLPFARCLHFRVAYNSPLSLCCLCTCSSVGVRVKTHTTPTANTLWT
jgi:hypothetical protein